MNLSIETLAKGKKELEELREIRATSLARVVTSIRQVSFTLFTLDHIICSQNLLNLNNISVSLNISRIFLRYGMKWVSILINKKVMSFRLISLIWKILKTPRYRIFSLDCFITKSHFFE